MSMGIKPGTIEGWGGLIGDGGSVLSGGYDEPVRPEPAWACFCPFGGPRPFIHENSVRTKRADAQEYLGTAWALDGETWQQGWRRAYCKGWRCIKVTVSAGAPHG